MLKRRKFSAEFKRGAVEQANQPGVSCGQVARELGRFTRRMCGSPAWFADSTNKNAQPRTVGR